MAQNTKRPKSDDHQDKNSIETRDTRWQAGQLCSRLGEYLVHPGTYGRFYDVMEIEC